MPLADHQCILTLIVHSSTIWCFDDGGEDVLWHKGVEDLVISKGTACESSSHHLVIAHSLRIRFSSWKRSPPVAAEILPETGEHSEQHCTVFSITLPTNGISEFKPCPIFFSLPTVSIAHFFILFFLAKCWFHRYSTYPFGKIHWSNKTLPWKH